MTGSTKQINKIASSATQIVTLNMQNNKKILETGIILWILSFYTEHQKIVCNALVRNDCHVSNKEVSSYLGLQSP